MAETSLHFDGLEVNVDLAKQYLQENEDAIKSMQFSEQREYKWGMEPKKKELLANKIKENTKLICQLEYIKINTPIEETGKNIQLMLQYLSLNKRYRATTKSGPVAIFKTSPLALIIHAFEMGALTVCEERNAVCYLILKLCEEAGLSRPQIKVYASSSASEVLYNIPKCTGIVSERSDLDSAVDVFLSYTTSSNCFWRLRKILVQESIYQSFKDLIEFKIKSKKIETKQYEELKNLCSNLYVYKNKVLLFDYASDADALQLDEAHMIFIEAYRTNKELITLVRENAKIDCVSLWCADVAEANEIAYNIPASLVWINDYGNFDGPAELSTFMINFFLANENALETYKNIVRIPRRIIESHKIWKTYDNKKRASIISDVLEKFNYTPISFEEGDYDCRIYEMIEVISNLKFNSINVDNGKICVTLDSSVGFNFDSNVFEADVFGSLVIGNGIITERSVGSKNDSLLLAEDLHRAGVPVWNIKCLDEDDRLEIEYHKFRYRTKIVMSNFGTIFAN